MKNQAIQLGAEVLRQGFMAIDYLEMRFVTPLFAREVRIGAEKVQTTGESAMSRAEGSEAKESQGRASQGADNRNAKSIRDCLLSDRGDVPGWVLVVLMTTGLVTAIWAVAAPRLNTILRNSLDSMNNIR